jgi:hypothetical protein
MVTGADGYEFGVTGRPDGANYLAEDAAAMKSGRFGAAGFALSSAGRTRSEELSRR